MGSRKERYELVLDGGGAQGTTGEETLLALGTRLANKEIRVSAILLRYGKQDNWRGVREFDPVSRNLVKVGPLSVSEQDEVEDPP